MLRAQAARQLGLSAAKYGISVKDVALRDPELALVLHIRPMQHYQFKGVNTPLPTKRVLALTTFATLIVSLGFAHRGEAQVQNRDIARDGGCYRMALDPRLQSLGFSLWLPETDSVLLADRFGAKLYTMNAEANLVSEQEIHGMPIAAVPLDRLNGRNLAERQILLLHGDESLDRYDTRLQLQASFSLHPEPRRQATEGYEVVSTYALAANSSGWLLGYGALDDRRTTNPLDVLGIFAVPATVGTTADNVLLVDTNPGGQDYFRVEHDYIAATGSDFYFLNMSSDAASPRLYRYAPSEPNPGPFPVTGSSIENRPMPLLNLAGVRSYVDLQARLDQFDGPASLTASDGLLHLLSRAPAGNGETTWSVQVLVPQPATNSVRDLGTTFLPTTSANITMTQAGGRTYVFEKGPFLTARGEQRIDEVLVLPTKWVRDRRTSPLKQPSRFLRCPRSGG